MERTEPLSPSSPFSPGSMEHHPHPEPHTPQSPPQQPKEKAKTVEIELHSLKAHFILNCRAEDLIPARYLRKADRLPIVQRTAWLFRGVQDARKVDLKKWSKVDIRFRGVYKTLKRVPPFCTGLYEDEDHGRIVDSNRRNRNGPPFDFHEAARKQSHVVYALLDEILKMLDIIRETDDHRSYFYLRPRLLTLNLEYWTGYREKHKDAPPTAGLVAVEFYPESIGSRTLIPVSTTTSQTSTRTSSLSNKFKHLLSQLLLNIHRLQPPGDQFPDQEVFLIGLHGSKLHVMRAVFPGYKTSRLWSGRHTPPSSSLSSSTNINTNEADHTHQMKPHIEPSETHTDRFYTKHNLERFMQQIEWHRLSTQANEPNLRVFRVLASQEFDLWIRDDFKAAVRLLSGLFMYLMSGWACCGALQDVFELVPYEEEGEAGEDTESEDEERQGGEKAAAEERRVAEQEREMEERERRSQEEDRERFWTREAMRGEVNDRIGGFGEFRQPWWDWVWEEKNENYDGRPRAAAEDDAEVVCRGP